MVEAAASVEAASVAAEAEPSDVGRRLLSPLNLAPCYRCKFVIAVDIGFHYAIAQQPVSLLS